MISLSLSEGFRISRTISVYRDESTGVSSSEQKNLAPVCGQVYNFENIRDAVAAQDEGKVNGKIVVRI